MDIQNKYKMLKKFNTNFIHWHKGMPLSPHHFQQTDLLYQNINHHLFNYSNPFCYGITSFTIDTTDLLNKNITILELQIIMENRMVINFQATDKQSLKLNLKNRHYNENDFLIYICLTKNNLIYNSQINEYQYYSVASDHVADFNDIEDNASILRLSPALYLSETKTDNSIPIFRCSMKGNQINLTEYDFPTPRFEMCKYSKEIIQKIIDKTLEKIKYAYSQSQVRNKDDYEKYGSLLQKGLYIFKLNINKESQPYEVWQGLARFYIEIINLIEIATVDNSILEYNHNDIRKSFYKVSNAIEQKLKLIDRFYANNIGKFVMENNIFTSNCNPTNSSNLILYFNQNTNYEQWVKNAIISSKAEFQNTINKRVMGFERKIIDYKTIGSFIVVNILIISKQSFDSIYIFNSVNEAECPNSIYLEI